MKNSLKIYTSVLFILCTYHLLSAQVTINSRFRAFSYEEMVRPLEAMERAYNDIENSINELTEYIIYVLSQNIDEQMREEMNIEYESIRTIYSHLRENGNIQYARHAYNRIRERVQNKVVSYNNRIAHENQRRREKEYESANAISQQVLDWHGTGFALENNYICTNYHVIEGAKKVTIQGIKGDFTTSYTAAVVAIDRFNDLAILKINDSEFKGFGTIPYRIKTSMADVGEEIFVLGYPLIATMGDEIKLSTGIISSRTGYQGDVSLYQISAPIQPGNSGGPLFDSQGNLIGIISAKHDGAENVGYAIKASYLRNVTESTVSASLLPENNLVADMPLTQKIKTLKNFVFMITCSSHEDKITPIKFGNSSSTNSIPSNIFIKNPYVNRATTTRAKIKSVTLSRDYTAIEIDLNNLDETNTDFYFSWCNVNENTYIEGDNIKYKMIKAEGIEIAPQKTSFTYPGQNLKFTLYFPPIPEDVTSLNLIEPGDSDWKFYGIRIRVR